MGQRSLTRTNRAYLWTGIGSLVVSIILSTSPCQAVESHRQVYQPVSLQPFVYDPNGLTENVALRKLNTVQVSMARTNVVHAVRSPLPFLSQWTRVMAMGEKQLDAMNHCNPEQDRCPKETLLWKMIIQKVKDQSFLEQLKSVNAYFNRWPYRVDIDVYGISEYWASPQEFLQNSGDCEDYSIIKYFALKQLGVPVEQMKIVLLIDVIRNTQHAVLTVRNGQDSYLLDNLSDLLLPQETYSHYLPLYSINEHYRWSYVTIALLNKNLLSRDL